MAKSRSHECLSCHRVWVSPVVMSEHSPALSGEKTEYCPKGCRVGVKSSPIYEPVYHLAKWEEVKQGKRVVFSDETLDALIDDLDARPDTDADAKLFFDRFVSIYNPKRVGIRDAYIGYLKQEGGK